jgi:transposase
MAAISYTLVETAKVSGVDPIAYLLEAATLARREPGPCSCPTPSKRERRRSRRLSERAVAVRTGHDGEIRLNCLHLLLSVLCLGV